MPDQRTYDWTDEQVEAAACAWLNGPQELRPSIRLALDAAYALMPTQQDATPDSDVVTWTPDDGPLADALAGLPDYHPVTITVPLYMAVAMTGQATSASWRRPTPAWATDSTIRAIVDMEGEVWVRNPRVADEWLWFDQVLIGDPVRKSAAFLVQHHSPITVLIDADGHHIEADR